MVDDASVLGHIALTVSDIERSASFYGRYFGFSSEQSFREGDSGPLIALLRKGSVVLELFQFEVANPLPHDRAVLEEDLSTVGVKHTAFAVDDIAKEYERMGSDGVECITPVSNLSNGMSYFFFKDPDGILVEVVEQIQR